MKLENFMVFDGTKGLDVDYTVNEGKINILAVDILSKRDIDGHL